MRLTFLTLCSYAVASTALATRFNGSETRDLERRALEPRFAFPDSSCGEDKRPRILRAGLQAYLLALAGYTAAAAQRTEKGAPIPISQKVFEPFFRNDPLFDEHVEDVMRIAVESTKPPPPLTFKTNLICVPATDARCQDAKVHAYTFKENPDLEAAAQFKEAIYLCDATVNEPFFSRELDEQCTPGIGDSALQHTVATVLLQQLIYLSSNPGQMSDWAYGSDASQALTGTVAADGAPIKDYFRSLHNADSYVFYGYASYKARWFLNPVTNVENILACIRQMFPRENVPANALAGVGQPPPDAGQPPPGLGQPATGTVETT